MSKPKISILCVTFNSADYLPEFFLSLEGLPGDAFETILVDNHSSDSTVETIRHWGGVFRLIENEQNLGWSVANNQGLEAAKGDFVFFANPDIWFEPENLQKLAGFLDEHPEFAAVAPQLLNPDASVQPSCRRLPGLADMVFQMAGLALFFPKTIFNRWKMPEFNHKSFREVEQPMASAILVRRTVFEKIGGLDERFFVFFGDVDLCRRLKEAGFRIAFWPEAKVFHRLGGSTRKMGTAFYFSSHFGFFRYLWKWSGPFQKLLLLFLWPLVLLTAGGRVAFGSVFRR